MSTDDQSIKPLQKFPHYNFEVITFATIFDYFVKHGCIWLSDQSGNTLPLHCEIEIEQNKMVDA